MSNDSYASPSFELVRRVRDLVAPGLRHTPMLRSEWLSQATGKDVYLKCENLQITGSFKVRGGLAAVAMLATPNRSDGVVACSAGNHGLGLAYAASLHGIACTIVVPQSVPAVKERGILALSARVIKAPFDGYDRTHAWTLQRLDELGGTFVSPFDDPVIVAANGGTTMMEILEDVPSLDTVVIPCGGGGCAIGAGVVARQLSPNTRVVGVNTDASPGMWLSRRDGRAHLHVDSQPTIADGIEGGVSERSFQSGRKYIDDVVAVSELTIRRAVSEIVYHEHVVVEGAGASGVAAVLDGVAGPVDGGPICIVLTGGNIDVSLLSSLLREYAANPTP